MSATNLKTLVTRITGAIEKARENATLTKHQRRELYRELFLLLAGDPAPKQKLIKFCKSVGKQNFFQKLLDSVGKTIKTPQVMHANMTKNVSLRNAQSIWKVNKSDLKMIEKIASIAEVDPEAEQHLLRRYYSSLDLHWFAEVERELEEVEVILSTQALEDILLGVFETYKVPKSKKEPYTEVFGLCLGMSSRQQITKKGSGTHTKWFVYVDRAVPQIRARSEIDSVTPNLQSIDALVETAHSLLPQLELIGDYHSHPYRNIKKLQEAKGWEASAIDEEDIHEMYRDLRQNEKRKHRMRISFIIAIAKGKNLNKPALHPAGLPSVLRLTVAGCHVYVSVYRILSNGAMTNDGVTLNRTPGETFHKVS